MATLLNRAEYAERRGVVPTAVTKWGNKGLLVKVEDPARPGKFLIDAEASDALIKNAVDITTGRPRNVETVAAEKSLNLVGQAKPPAPSLEPAPMGEMEQARLEHMRERILRQQLERAELTGQLVSVQEYTSRAGDLGRMIRERSHSLIRQLSERLATETEPRKIVSILAGEFDKMFEQVADEIDKDAEDELAADAALAEAETQDELDFEDEP